MISDYASLYCRHSAPPDCRVLSCRLGLGCEWIPSPPQLYRLTSPAYQQASIAASSSTETPCVVARGVCWKSQIHTSLSKHNTLRNSIGYLNHPNVIVIASVQVSARDVHQCTAPNPSFHRLPNLPLLLAAFCFAV